MRLERRAAIPLSFAYHDAGDQAGYTCVDMHNRAPRKIHHFPIPKQSPVTRPGHVADGEVGEQSPGNTEEHHCAKFHTLSKRSHHQRRGDDDEGHLKRYEHCFRDAS